MIEDDPNATLVGAVWVLEAGAVDDPQHHGELAHAVEHLVFSLADAEGVSPWQRLLDLGGININGSTRLEHTLFQTFGPRGQLDHLVAIELGRMAQPLGNANEDALAAELVRQRSVLQEERNARDDAAPAEGRVLLARLFSAPHPYASAGGALDEPDRAFSNADVRSFVQKQYQPQKMTLVLSGAIPPDWDARLWAMMPPSLAGDAAAPRAPQRRPLAPSSPPTGPDAGMVTVKSTGVLPHLRIGWWLPGARGLDAAPLEILGQIVDQALAWAIEAGELPNVLRSAARTIVAGGGSFLECLLLLRDERDAEAVRARVIEIVTKQALSSQILYGAAQRTTLKWVTLNAALRLQSLPARTLTRAELAHHDPGAGLSALLATVNRITAGDLSDLAERHLTAAASRSVLLVRSAGLGARRDPALVAREALMTLVPPTRTIEAPRPESDSVRVPPEVADAPVVAPVVHSPEQVREAAVAAPMGNARVARLANGLTVIVLHRSGLPFVSMVLGYHSVPSREDPPGVWLAAPFGRHYENIWGAIERDILAEEFANADDVGEELATYSSLTGEALSYLADKAQTLYLRWPDEPFERWSVTAAAEEKTLDGRAQRRFASGLWGEHVYGIQIPAVQVMERNQAEVEKWIDHIERPENGALVIVGDVDPEDAIKSVASRLRGAWSARSATLMPLAAPPAPVVAARRMGPPPVQVTRVPGRKTASIRFGCFLPPVRTPRDGVVGDLVASLIERQLFERLRLHEGKSYTPRVAASRLWGGAAVLEGAFDIDDGALGEGMSAVQSLLRERGEPVFDAGTLEHARWRLALANAARYSGNDEIARALFAAWKLGWQPSALDETPSHLSTVGGSDVQTALDACRASAVISVLAPPTAQVQSLDVGGEPARH